MKTKIKIKAGDTVEYTCICGVIHVKVKAVKSDGKLILNTRAKNKLIKTSSGRHKNGDLISLLKNVCVLPHRVKKV